MFQNKWIKKTGVFLLAGVLTFSMAACGSGAEKKPEIEPASQAAETVETETQTEVTETQAQVTETTAPETETEEAVGMVNPFSEFETLSAACRAAGVEIEIPEGPEGYPVTCYRAARDTGLLEIVYLDGPANSEDSTEAYRIRKQAGEDDISGDYTEYTDLMEQEMEGGYYVTLKGNDGAVYCMTWTNGGYSYAVNIDMDGNGMPEYDALELAARIK